MASYCAVPSTVFPTRGYRGMATSTPESGDAHTWRRSHLATPKAVNTLTFLFGAPLVGPTVRLTLTLVNAWGRVGTQAPQS